jgi:UDP-2,3-diacylglucosamine hydrolase
MSAEAVFFISDAHLGADDAGSPSRREQLLHGFLESLPGRASALYVVGDLFDFWFEYGTAIPRLHFRSLAALDRLRRSGVEITLMNGNHDFYLGPFLRDDLGLSTHDGALPLTLQGRRVWLHHGDGLLGGDLGYKVLKRILRNPLSISLYRWLHPDLGIPLAHRVSNLSRASRAERPIDGDQMWRKVAAPRFAEGFDTVMIGHFHQTFERRDGEHAFFVLGDWIDRFSYVVLEHGAFRLDTWPAGTEARSADDALPLRTAR